MKKRGKSRRRGLYNSRGGERKASGRSTTDRLKRGPPLMGKRSIRGALVTSTGRRGGESGGESKGLSDGKGPCERGLKKVGGECVK